MAQKKLPTVDNGGGPAHPEVTAMLRRLFICFLSLVIPLSGYCEAHMNDTLKFHKNFTAHAYTRNDTQNVERLIVAVSREHDDFAKCQAYMDTALDISWELNYKNGYARALVTKGILYSSTGDVKNALKYFNAALPICSAYHLLLTKSAILNNLGNLYYNLAQNDSAFKCDERALSIQKEIHDSEGIARSYGNLARTFYEMGDYKKSNDYLLLSVELYKAHGFDEGIGDDYSNVGVNYMKLKKYKEALNYLFQALKIFDKMPGYSGATPVYQNLGECYSIAGNKDSALYWLNKALDGARGSKNKSVQIDVLTNLGDMAFDEGKLGDAERYFKECFKIASELGYLNSLYLANRSLAKLYSKKGDFKNAFKYQEQTAALKDSMLNEQKQKDVATLTTKFETKEVEAKNTSLQKENSIQKLRLQREDIFLFGGGSVAVLLLALSVVIVRNNKLRSNQKLLQVEQRQLLAQMNPHFIFNCLNSIQQYIIQNDAANANRYLADFALLMRQTLDNSKDGIISLQREIEYLENYLSLESMRFENKFTFSLRCAPDISPNTVEIPSMIIQPFVENAIHHGLRNLEGKTGILNIGFYEKDNCLYCEVDDNGIGMEESQKLKEQRFIKYQSHGMELTRQRLALVSKMNSAEYKVTVVNKADAQGHSLGTTIIIKFQIRK